MGLITEQRAYYHAKNDSRNGYLEEISKITPPKFHPLLLRGKHSYCIIFVNRIDRNFGNFRSKKKKKRKVKNNEHFIFSIICISLYVSTRGWNDSFRLICTKLTLKRFVSRIDNFSIFSITKIFRVVRSLILV